MNDGINSFAGEEVDDVLEKAYVGDNVHPVISQSGLERTELKAEQLSEVLQSNLEADSKIDSLQKENDSLRIKLQNKETREVQYKECIVKLESKMKRMEESTNVVWDVLF